MIQNVIQMLRWPKLIETVENGSCQVVKTHRIERWLALEIKLLGKRLRLN
jgi:hypothetical protein